MAMGAHIGQIVDYLTRKTGLVLSTSQLDELARYIERREHLKDGDFATHLSDPNEFRMLIDCLTVKETFFYRYAAQFDAFRDLLLPKFLARADEESRHVRVWSAGCCTGEEAYTFALIAAERGVLDRVEILATDINESYLEAAMTGVFSQRSVAQLPGHLLANYFREQHGRFTIDQRIREHVTLKWLNLAEPSYPSFINGTANVDMIFCRNVLIYFDKSLIRAIIDRFADCLNEGGVLALGHSEMLPRDWTLSVQPIGDAFFYQRPAAEASPAQAPANSPPEGGRPTESRAMESLKLNPVADARDLTAMLDAAEQLANHGKGAEAAQICRDAIRLDDSLVRGHYLLGLLSLDTPSKAHRHFRRAVDLNPAHLPARLHLAESAEKMGRVAEAAHEYRNLERLARAKPPDEVLDPLEGITYGMLALIGHGALRRLE